MDTSYTQTHLGKSIDKVEAQDLTDYFTVDREESLTLEFKSFHQRENDIKHKESGVMRAICAFLNSSGGLLIWGAPTEIKRSSGYKVCSGPLSPVEKRYSKDEFISKLSTKIIPFASPAQFRAIEIEEGKYVYLFDVPESATKPHQFDDRYFIRLDGQSKAAPHYVIDALFKQVKRPVLSIQLSAVVFRPYSPMTRIDCEPELHLSGTISNLTEGINEKLPYYRVQVEGGDILKEKRFEYVTKDVLRESIQSILPCGLEAKFSEIIKVSFQSNSDQIYTKITITIGGELSAPTSRTFSYMLERRINDKGFVADIRLLSLH